MSGIFLSFNNSASSGTDLIRTAFKLADSRGKNSSSLLQCSDLSNLQLIKSRAGLESLSCKLLSSSKLVVGYCGLNVLNADEISPQICDEMLLFSDGMVLNRPVKVNEFRVNTATNMDFLQQLILDALNQGIELKLAVERSLAQIKGNVNALLLFPKRGKLLALSNHGSLFVSESEGQLLIASERSWLQKHSEQARQIHGVLEFEVGAAAVEYRLDTQQFFEDTPAVVMLSGDATLLQYKIHDLKRCTRCILPETMPYIRFDQQGICNYCHSYKKRNQPKDKQRLHELVEPYRRSQGYDCIVPFSGGRDSCFALHLIVNELKLKPITYTYDWGMVTDVGRRNIALMCGAMGVENIIIADDIEKKRKNIAMNFAAWLKSPHLGMLNILTAGDKHFFRHINKVKEETGVSLNLWGVNPLEVTHFKTGFLGIEPDFERQKVYASGKMGQLRYQGKRFQQMLNSPGYFNASLWDTLSGEYYRSSAPKTDYFHMFDYWQWSEKEINGLLTNYNWELSSDTPTTWRIGDGTAGIYNYIYYTLAGFTEHDTFRSNQVREGELTRAEALKLVEVENAPCHDNLRWYLQSIGFDFTDTIKRINSIPRLHEKLY